MDNISYEILKGFLQVFIDAVHTKKVQESGKPLDYEDIKQEINDFFTSDMGGKLPQANETDKERLLNDISGNYLVTNGEPLTVVINKDSPRWLDAKKP